MLDEKYVIYLYIITTLYKLYADLNFDCKSFTLIFYVKKK